MLPSDLWLVFGATAVVAVLLLSRAWRTAGLWLALAIAGQMASLALYVAGPGVTYQHLRFEHGALRTALALGVVALQAVVVSIGLSKHAAELRSGLARLLPGWRASAFVLLVALAAAKISRPGDRSAGEFALAAALHLVALANFALVGLTLAREPLASWSARLERLLGRSNDAPEPGGLDRFAWSVALGATLLAALLNVVAYERSPHVPDEVVYLLHARYFAAGKLWLEPPPVPAAFDLDLMLLDQGKWYCPVPPGWPAVLALGVRAGVPWLVNPLLGGVAVLLAYLLLRELFDRRSARIGILLVAASPWFTFLNMSFMTHSLTLASALLAALGVARSRRTGSLGWAALAGVATGGIALIRPLDGLLVAGALGVWSIGFGGARLRLAAIATLVVVTGAVGALTLPYNQLLTGRASDFPIQHYVDVVYGPGKNNMGFGKEKGLGWSGLDPWPGHTPQEALITAQFNLFGLDAEGFGWACGSLALVWLWLLRGRWSRSERAFAAFAAGIIGSSLLYWFSGGPDFGARYWYLVFPSLVVLCVGGLARASEATGSSARTLASVAAACLVAQVTWVPWRAADKYHGYRGVEPGKLESARVEQLSDALVLVAGRRHPDFAEAALLNRFEDDDSTVTVAWLRDEATLEALLAAYPKRTLYGLREGRLVGPLDADSARTLAREVADAIEGVR